MKHIYLSFLACLLFVLLSLSCEEESSDNIWVDPKPIEDIIGTQTKITPDTEWMDNSGKKINAHSGGIYYEKGDYYWYGEYKIEGSAENKGYTGGGMSCYKSKDLINWKNYGIVLPVDYQNKSADLAFGCIFQRPKVVFNRKTKRYVALFKLYLIGNGYRICHTGVATAYYPTGPFVYSHKFLAASDSVGSGDFALYQNDNGDLYHITVRKSDREVVAAKMDDNYMYPATEYTRCIGVTRSTEGLAIMKRNGIFHLLGSGSSGWDPNPARYFTSTSIYGPWTNRGNPCQGTNPISGLGPDKTFGGQSTFIAKVEGKDNQYISMFDVWTPNDAANSTYIWLPFRVNDSNRFTIKWQSDWNFDWFNSN